MPNISANTPALPDTQAIPSQPIARLGAAPGRSRHQPGGCTRRVNASRCASGTGGVSQVVSRALTVAIATMASSRYSARASGNRGYSTSADDTAATMPAISVHAFARHQNHRSIDGRPSPAPSAMKSRHACSMLSIRDATTTPIAVSSITESRLTQTSRDWLASGATKRRYRSWVR